MSFDLATEFRGQPLTEEQADEIVGWTIVDQAFPEPPTEQRIVMRAAVMLLIRTMLSRGWRIEAPDTDQ